MAELRFTRRALRDIQGLAPEFRRRLEVALDRLMEEPHAGDALHGNWDGCWKLRVGEYRIIYRIADTKTVEIQYVRHRREAYRR